jgi:radical SAM protein with 4Fe4S-binding SPASM domain
MCQISVLSKRRKRHAKLRNLKLIIQQIPTATHFTLQGLGEPLLNPHLFDLLDLLKSFGVDSSFVTNGTLLDKENTQKLLGSGLRDLTVSIDGYDKKSFEAIRLGADFDAVMNNVEYFVKQRKKTGAGPSLGIMTIASRETVRYMPEVIRLARRLEVDQLTIKGLNSGSDPFSPLDEKDITTLNELSRSARPFPVSIGCERRPDTGLRCRWPWVSTYVTVEGDVTPCCNCPNPEDLIMGNIYLDSFEKIWNGAPYQRFREDLRTGMPEICKGCPDY